LQDLNKVLRADFLRVQSLLEAGVTQLKEYILNGRNVEYCTFCILANIAAQFFCFLRDDPLVMILGGEVDEPPIL
jgi:hypothetical protein